MDSINERFREARKMLNMSQEAFAAGANRTRSEISNIEYGKTTPKQEVILAVCAAHGIDRIWLETGVGEPFREADPDEEVAKALAKVLGGSEESKARLIRAVANLPEELAEAAIEVLRNLAEQFK